MQMQQLHPTRYAVSKSTVARIIRTLRIPVPSQKNLMTVEFRMTENSYAAGYGVKYMNTWKHVCRRVRLIQHLYHIYKNIVPFKLNRPEIQTVWIEGRDNQEYGHSGKEKGSHLIKPGYIIEKRTTER